MKNIIKTIIFASMCVSQAQAINVKSYCDGLSFLDRFFSAAGLEICKNTKLSFEHSVLYYKCVFPEEYHALNAQRLKENFYNNLTEKNKNKFKYVAHKKASINLDHKLVMNGLYRRSFILNKDFNEFKCL